MLQKTTNFKKKAEKDEKIRAYFVCGKEGHLAKNCRYRKDRDDGKPNKKVNVTIDNGDEAGGSRYGNFLVVFSAIQSTDWWLILVRIYMYALTYPCLLLTRESGLPPS